MKRERIVKKDDKFDSAQYFMEHGIDLEKRRIMIDRDINAESVGWVIRGIYKMADVSAELPLDLYINSNGGEIYDGLALYDVLRSLSGITVRTHALGKIMSMAFIIYLAGDQRYSYPNATFMNHSSADSLDGKLHHLKTSLKEVQRQEDICLDILMERTSKKDRSFWRKSVEYKDQYYNVEQMKELGVVTHE